MPKRMPRQPKAAAARNAVMDEDDFTLHAGDDDFPLHPPRGPRRFVSPDPAWRRLVMRPSLYLGPLIVSAAVSAFLVNALMLQNGARGTMTLGWPFNAISKSSIERLNPMTKDQPIVPVPPKRTDASDINVPSATPKANVSNATDPYAALIKETAQTVPLGDPALQRAQRVLNRLGYGPIPVDGVMSPSMRAALQRFGRDRGLTPGPQTELVVLKQLGRTGDTTQD